MSGRATTVPPVELSVRREWLLLTLFAASVGFGILASTLWPSSLWGAHFLAYLPIGWWIAAPLALLAMLPQAARLLPGPREVPGAPRRWIPWIAGLGAALLFWLCRERHLFWGDGLPLSINIPAGQSFHPDEPLSIYLHQLIYRLGGGAWSGAEAVAIGSVLAGSLFVGRAVFWLARRIPDPTTALLAAFALLTQGFTQIFYGYVENYGYLAVALLFFLTWGVDFLEGRVGAFRPLAAALVASALHVMGWLTIPLALVLVALGVRDPRRRPATVIAVGALGGVAALLVGLTAGLYGADSPLARFTVAVRRLLEPRVESGAATLTPGAIGDLVNELMILGPLSLPLALLIFMLLPRPRLRDDPGGAFLVLAAVAFTAPVFLVGGWGLGTARDWDIFAAPAVAAALLGVVMIARHAGPLTARRLLLALLAASVFHTAPWIALNASQERTMKRVAELPLGGGRGPMMLGTHFLNAGDLGAAEHWFDESLAADPTNVNSQSGLGLALARQGRLDEAIGPMRRAVALSPRKVEYRRDLGALYFELERWRDSAHEAEQLLHVTPEDRGAWLGLAECYRRLEQPDSAAMVMKVAIRNLGPDAELLDRLARDFEHAVVNHALAADWPAAEAMFREMETSFPADPRTEKLRRGLSAR